MFKAKHILLCLLLSSNLLLAQDNKTLGLVLSGGGAKGLAYIGMLDVIQSTGIPISCIAGTSIGSIIGGMTALGYSPHYLDSLATNMDWMFLFGNTVKPHNLSLSEKQLKNHYFLTLSINDKFKLDIPTGILSGQRVEDLFTRLYSPFYMIDDFSKFPTPFFCILTDMETGKEVEMTKGYFPDAIRASMSIPIALIPKSIDNSLYIDGGFVNNYPISNMKDKGFGTIVGLDVRGDPANSDSILTIVDIINRYIDVNRLISDETATLDSIINIKPNLKKINIASFARNQEIIEAGKEAALLHIDKLRSIADSLQQKGCEPFQFLNTHPLDSVFVESIELRGLHNVHPNNIRTCFEFKVPGYVKLSRIEETLENMRGTYYFKYVTYQLLPGIDGATLVIRLEENSFNTLSLGFNFSKYKYATLMLNSTFRNIKGSFLSFDIGLSTFPYFYSSFIFNSQKNIQSGISINVYTLPTYSYTENGVSSKYYNFNTSSDIFLLLNLSMKSYLKMGAQFETFSSLLHLSSINIENLGDQYINAFFQIKVNTIDKLAFPKNGLYLQLLSKGILLDVSKSKSNSFMTNTFNMLISNTKKTPKIDITLNSYIDMGVSFFNNNASFYSYYLGGTEPQAFMNFIPFGGYKYMELSANNIIHLREDLQFNFLKKHYITLSIGVASLNDDIMKRIIDYENLHFYVGLLYGFDAGIFPVKLSSYIPIAKKGIEFYITIGNFLNPDI